VSEPEPTSEPEPEPASEAQQELADVQDHAAPAGLSTEPSSHTSSLSELAMPPEETAETTTEAVEPAASAEPTEAVEPSAGAGTTEAADPAASQAEEAAAAPETEAAPEVPPATPVESLIDAVNRAVAAVAAELHLPEPSEAPEQTAAVLTKAREALASLEQQLSGLLHAQQSDHDTRLKAAIAQHEAELRKLHEQEVEKLHGRLREEHEATVRERLQQYAAALKQVRGVACRLEATTTVAHVHALAPRLHSSCSLQQLALHQQRLAEALDERYQASMNAERAERLAQLNQVALQLKVLEKVLRQQIQIAVWTRQHAFCLAMSSPADVAHALANAACAP